MTNSLGYCGSITN